MAKMTEHDEGTADHAGDRAEADEKVVRPAELPDTTDENGMPLENPSG